MSIYASEWVVDADDHADGCDRWVRIPPGGSEDGYPVVAVGAEGRYGLDDTRPCTCGTGPVVYQGSHVLPADIDARGGSVDLGAIPGFISRGDRRLCDEESCAKPGNQCCDVVWPWLRLSLVPRAGKFAAVLLDRDQVAGLYEYLGDWLDRAIPDPPSKEEVGAGGAA